MTNSSFLLALQAASIESKGGLFDFNATLPLMALQILLLVAVLDILFYKPIAKVIEQRDQYVRGNLVKASEMLSKAESMMKRHEQDVEKERKEAQLIMSTAEKEAQELVAKQLGETQIGLEALMSDTLEQLNIQKEETVNALRKQVPALSEQVKVKLLND